jgi:hypothetical protein
MIKSLEHKVVRDICIGFFFIYSKYVYMVGYDIRLDGRCKNHADTISTSHLKQKMLGSSYFLFRIFFVGSMDVWKSLFDNLTTCKNVKYNL